MTDEEKVELVRASYAAWSRRDLAAMHEHVHPDFELIQAQEVPGATTYGGLEGLEEVSRQFAETWEEFEQKPIEFKVAGDLLAARVHQRARGRGSGIVVEQDVGHVVEMRGRRLARIVTYSDPSEAFRAIESSR